MTDRGRGGAPQGRTLITGATGFVGTALVRRLAASGAQVRIALRQPPSARHTDADVATVGDIGPATDWLSALRDVDAVVHLAARAHVVDERAPDAYALYREVNALAVLRLAQAAAAARVRRFVFMSSARVHGSRSTGAPFREASPLAADDPYGRSKAEAERGLAEIASRTGLEVVILRPPLVYGPGARGNFARLAGLVGRGVPLPLASVRNRRSLVFLDNLVDAAVRCLIDPAAAGQTFLVSDGEDVSTAELIRRMGRAMHRPARLVPFPPSLLRLAGTLLGRSADVGRLLDDFVVDSSHLRATLGWTPPFGLDEGLSRTAAQTSARAGGGG